VGAAVALGALLACYERAQTRFAHELPLTRVACGGPGRPPCPSCSSCHRVPEDCAACHGDDSGAPPPDLSGNSNAAAPGVGAHRERTW
jgi:hypothetical protein